MATDIEKWKRIKAERAAAAKAAKAASVAASEPAVTPAVQPAPSAPPVVPPQFTPSATPRVEAQLSEALSRLATAEQDHRAVLLSCDLDAADPAVAGAWEAVRDARHRVELMRSMLDVARAKDEADARAIQSATLAAQAAEVEKRLAERDAAISRLADAIALLAEAHHEAVDANTAVLNAFPGVVDPGMLTGHAALARLVKAEMYRVSARPAPLGALGVYQHPALPGAECPDLRMTHNPGAVPRMVDTVSEASAYAMAKLRASIPVVMVAAPSAPPVVPPCQVRTAAEIMAEMKPIPLDIVPAPAMASHVTAAEDEIVTNGPDTEPTAPAAPADEPVFEPAE